MAPHAARPGPDVEVHRDVAYDRIHGIDWTYSCRPPEPIAPPCSSLFTAVDS